MPFVYILLCHDGTLYTGAAKDLTARLRQHEAGRASRYTRARLPVRLAWSRRVRTWSAALKQEYRIKQLSRSAKSEIVAAGSEARTRRATKSAPRRAATARTSRRAAAKGRRRG